MLSQPEATHASGLVRRFYPGLDGLRAIAFLLVFLAHYGPLVSSFALLQWGWVGVDIFFVLSGFLITGILYDSLDRQHYFRNFYVRRALRICPLFYGFWLVLLLLTPVLHVRWNVYMAAMAGYFGNFFCSGAYLGLHADPGLIAYDSVRHANQLSIINIDHFWSLCVEEQFYFVWPFLIWLVRDRRRLLQVCGSVAVVSPVARALYAYVHPPAVLHGAVYMSTFFRSDALLIGAAVALWLRGPAAPAHIIRRWALVSIPLFFFVLGTLVSFHTDLHSFSAWDIQVSSFGYTLVDLAAAGVLFLAIDPHSWVARALRFRPLAWLGRMSYGLYFFHQLLIVHFQPLLKKSAAHHLGFLVPLIAFSSTLAFAWLSFRFLESPFLALKERFALRPGAVADPPPVSVPLHIEYAGQATGLMTMRQQAKA